MYHIKQPKVAAFTCWANVALALAVLTGLVLGLASAAQASEKDEASMASAARNTGSNSLIHSTSPYLLQHAHNPVDWYPWGGEALDKARAENKPIFLSIGYAACHWCHVMERESFENEQIAALLNRYFVSIKVDREERPDLDEVYMTATMMLNQGQGGWPMSVFLTPDLKPFFAGTYFPPEPRYGRPGFGDVVQRLAELWETERGRVVGSAEELASAMQGLRTVPGGEGTLTRETISKAAETVAQQFDRRNGGLPGGGTNKFPPCAAMALLLREYRHSQEAGSPNEDYLGLVKLTLERMARGGIYDQLGGGIARYSTDTKWLVPHFEKMLYDQAQVADIYLEAYQVTGERFYADVAADIFDYVITDLQLPEGGFCSARDADSEGEEGKYYVWTQAEVEEVLGKEDAGLFASYYDVSEAGNWEGRNILNVPRPPETVAKLNEISVEELERRLEPMRARLLTARAERMPPLLDDKVLTAWNGLMIASLAKGAQVLGVEEYAKAAERAADFVLGKLRKDGRLLRTYRAGTAHIPGFLSDYAFFIEGLLNLYEVTFEARWLRTAYELNETLIAHFWDEEGGGFFYTADDAEKLLVRTKDAGDQAVPSGNSAQLLNLYRLALLSGRKDWREKADRTLAAFAGQAAEHPLAYERLLCTADFQMSRPKEVAVVGPADAESTREMLRALHERFVPHKVIVLLDPAAREGIWLKDHVPLLEGKTMLDGQPTAYVCEDYSCRAPVTAAGALAAQLR
ncbi:MAG: thioredoxin domain-containing protein [Phycisphaerales bacterium]|nr:MAG: thioredoxin domain-containing protein [Phycisphaerales bacterium]